MFFDRGLKGKVVTLAKPDGNIAPKKPLRRSSLREYVERRTRAKRDIVWLQEQLVIDVTRRLRQRYRAQTRHLEPKPTFEDWLLDCGSLDRTYDLTDGVRRFRAMQTLEEASAITLGSNTALTWFCEALATQLQLPEGITVVIAPPRPWQGNDPAVKLLFVIVEKA